MAASKNIKKKPNKTKGKSVTMTLSVEKASWDEERAQWEAKCERLKGQIKTLEDKMSLIRVHANHIVAILS